MYYHDCHCHYNLNQQIKENADHTVTVKNKQTKPKCTFNAEKCITYRLNELASLQIH